MRAKTLAMLAVAAMVATLLVALPVSGAAQAAGCDPEYVSVSGSRIYVTPTGVDDTANLQCALDAAASMHRGHVLLARGDFYTSFLAVQGLDGSVRGAGSDLTHVYSLPEGLDCLGRFEATGETSMVIFGGGNVTLRDFTVGVGGNHVCEAPWFEFVDPDGFGIIDGSIEAIAIMPHLPVAGVCPDPLPISATVFDVTVDGDLVYDFVSPIQVWDGFSHGVMVAPFHQTWDACPRTGTVGDIVIQRSDFVEVLLGVTVAVVDDSAVRVVGNDFVDTIWGVSINDLSGSHAVVANNDIDGVWAGVLAFARDFPGDEPYRIDIRNNTVRGNEFTDGIGIIDYASEVVGYPLIDATIVGNEIELIESPYTGILVIGDPEGLIARNDVYGSGSVGVALVADSWRVVNNDLTGFDAWDADVVLAGNENRVVCLSSDDQVLDFGFDNTIIGCSLLETGASLAATAESESAVDFLERYEAKPGHGW